MFEIDYRANFMKSNLFLQVIIGCLIFLATAVAKAEPVTPQEARQFAESKGKELLMDFQEPDLQTRYAKLDKLFIDYIDVDYVSRFVVGKYWKQMTAEQQSEYQQLFVRYGLAFYKTLPLDYAQNLTYELKEAALDGKFTTVSANIRVYIGEEAQNITLVFRLHRVKNQIKVVDVKVAESSLLLAYRGKFYELIAKDEGDMGWFLEDLTDLVTSLERNLQENVSLQQKHLELNPKND
jgi:phospholipid transport system substrate-binding protein